jgi:hypothetical protein
MTPTCAVSLADALRRLTAYRSIRPNANRRRLAKPKPRASPRRPCQRRAALQFFRPPTGSAAELLLLLRPPDSAGSHGLTPTARAATAIVLMLRDAGALCTVHPRSRVTPPRAPRWRYPCPSPIRPHERPRREFAWNEPTASIVPFESAHRRRGSAPRWTAVEHARPRFTTEKHACTTAQRGEEHPIVLGERPPSYHVRRLRSRGQ